MTLHNLCLDQNVEAPIYRCMFYVKEDDKWSVYDNYRDNDAEYRGFARGECRRQLTNKLEQFGKT
jgi:hypothetical protein